MTIPSGYATTIQASGLTFSTPGCWQVTGTAGGRSLQFILHLAEPAGLPQRTPRLDFGSPGQDSQHPAFDFESPCQVTNARPSISRVPAGPANATPAPKQDAPQVYRPGGGVTPPRLVKEVKPKYTPRGDGARKFKAWVKLEAVVLATGEVGDVEVIESLDKVYGLDDEAVKCITSVALRARHEGRQAGRRSSRSRDDVYAEVVREPIANEARVSVGRAFARRSPRTRSAVRQGC